MAVRRFYYGRPPRKLYRRGCTLRWTDYALKKTGARTLAEFQRSYGLPETGEADLVTSPALWDYLAGSRCPRMGPPETLSQSAQPYTTTIPPD